MPHTSDRTYIADFGLDGFYGPFPTRADARAWIDAHAKTVSMQRYCVIRTLNAPTRDRSIP